MPTIEEFSKTLFKKLSGGEVIGLSGDLGAGKTFFTQKLAKYMGVSEFVVSPTFTLIQIYSGKLSSGKKIKLFHLDFYRIGSYNELEALGLIDFLGKPDVVSIIEWPELFKDALPEHTQFFNLKNGQISQAI